VETTDRHQTFLARQITRARGHITQEDLAYRVREVTGGKLTPAATDISRYERAVHAPRMAMLAAIAKATGRDIEFFLTEADEDEDEESALRALATNALSIGQYDMADSLLVLARGAAARKTRNDNAPARIPSKEARTEALTKGV
jgi:transcriptional regulator with XRE-family HTH domain